MAEVRQELTISGDTVSGTVRGVPAGTGRVFTINGYDAGGSVVYTGAATAEVLAGQQVTVRIVLRPAVAGGPEEGITATLPGGATVDFLWIEPGTFTMGTTEEQEQLLRSKGLWGDWFENEHPAHQVTISKGFYLGKHEITQAQWQAATGTEPWSGQSNVQSSPGNPAVYISWNDVQELVRKLNQAAGEEVYRLPTDAEWEYACRAGTSTLWSFGDDESQLGEYAWYDQNAWNVGEQYSHVVGTKKPNPWGLFDMHGNAWEWCQDWWYRVYTNEAQVDPAGPTAGSARVGRGGGFRGDAQGVRSAYRDDVEPDGRPGANFGARLVRTK
jgi:formylglycine-generating enzyme required for sulfatase activity